MQRFVLRENIRLFRSYLEGDDGGQQRQYVRTMLASMQRELALLDATSLGAQHFDSEFCDSPSRGRTIFQHLLEDSSRSYLIVDPRPGLHIVDINDAYAKATMTQRDAVAGANLFNVFPDNPAFADADGVSNVFSSLRRAAHRRVPHVMPIQRYDIRDPSGRFVERYWRAVNTPLFNKSGVLVWLLHHVEDVTAQVLDIAVAE